MENFKFKKAYGQNFLSDYNIILNIVSKTDIKDNSLVLEIGPGSGVLTKELAKHSKTVLAYEIDERLEEILDGNLKDCKNVNIIYDDFMHRNIMDDIKEYEYDHIYVVANIPYYITTAILTKLIDSKIPFEKITIMIQKEVADRFMAKPKSRNYGSITVFLNYYFDIYKLFDVGRDCFIPKPNVDSTVISLIRKEKMNKVNNEELFMKFIHDAFQFKRKNLRNNLKNYDLEKILNILEKYHLDLTARAEELPLEVFIDIVNNLN